MTGLGLGIPQVFGPQGDGGAERIRRLLQDVGQPKTDPNTAAATTLEYRGQWQPKPNGAETGHGEVPTAWAIERATENDRAIASYGWAGGAQLCLSNAFRQVNEMEAQAQDLVDSGTCTEDDAAVQCIRAIAHATEERESLMRRQWCDIDFQQGDKANWELLRHLERDFAGQLASTAARQLQQEATRCDSVAQSAGEEVAQDVGHIKADRITALPWYNFKMIDGMIGGRVYLSARIGGSGLDLVGHDDESGRQRWMIEPGGDKASFFKVPAKENAVVDNGPVDANVWCWIRVLGGTPPSRRFLGHGPTGLELCAFDDGSGRQRWLLRFDDRGERVTFEPVSLARDKPSLRSEGVGNERKLLGVDSDGGVGLYTASEDGRFCRWYLPSFCVEESETKSTLPTVAKRNGGASNDVVALAAGSGSDGAVALANLSPEQMLRVLSQNRNLGAAIDLVGAYLKNYAIDKADRLCARIEPLCRERGGVWLLKFLNFYSTVRMKQSRHDEALRMYKEYETLIKFSPNEAWELYDTVYRNFGWIHTSLQNYQTALEYFEKAVNVKRANGVCAHWFDQWDLGKTHARLSLQQGKIRNLELAFDLIVEGLGMHRKAEPQDTIMRCKMLNSAGECAVVLGDLGNYAPDDQTRWYDKAIDLHSEAYHLYLTVLGPMKPLTGWCMEDFAGALRRRGRLGEAKDLVRGAFKVECTKDIIKLSSMARLLKELLELHRLTGDNDGLAQSQDAINYGLDNLQRRKIDQEEPVSYASLLQTVAEVLLANSEGNRDGAISFLDEAIKYTRQGIGKHEAQGHRDAPNQERPAGKETCLADDADRIGMPRAGQQKIEVDGAQLLLTLQSMRSKLLDRAFVQPRDPMIVQHASDNESKASCGLDAPPCDRVDTEAQQHRKLACPGSMSSSRGPQIPLEFEIISSDSDDDCVGNLEFVRVD